jgi:hypothetical protein
MNGLLIRTAPAVHRNGLTIKPYVYNGTGKDVLTAFMDTIPGPQREHKTGSVHYDSDGGPRCGRTGNPKLSEDPGEVTCRFCRRILDGTHGTGNRQPDLPCGTPAAYRRHFRRGEKPCESCQQAEARRKAAYRRPA